MDLISPSKANSAGTSPAADRAPTGFHGEGARGESRGAAVEFDASGNGPTLVLVPGSVSTGAAWRTVTSHLAPRYRYVTTSLLGYGRTAERRSVHGSLPARVAGRSSADPSSAAVRNLVAIAAGLGLLPFLPVGRLQPAVSRVGDRWSSRERKG